MHKIILALAVFAAACSSPSDAAKPPPAQSAAASGSAATPATPPSDTITLATSTHLSHVDLAPRNFVCERVKLLNDKASCDAEYTDSGEAHVHSARITWDVQSEKGTVKVTRACTLVAGAVGMTCGELEYVPPQPKVDDAKAAQAKGAKK